MLSTAKNMQTCLRCVGKIESGTVVLCPDDGKPILGHAQTGECPRHLLTQPLTIGGVAHGAAGIAKAVVGIGSASDELVAKRTALCAGCDKAVMVAGTFRQCSICKCATWAKVRNAGEACPAGKW